MTPRLETLSEKKLVGLSVGMSFADNKTLRLWQNFMPRRSEIPHVVSTSLFSIEKYPPHYFNHFNPATEFRKWAAVEVPSFDMIPAGMHTIIIPTGLYAVFLHKGAASEGFKTYQYIFGTWMPGSEFTTDDRPHFAVMDHRYKNNDPDSEEDIWIPIKRKSQIDNDSGPSVYSH